ncbi:MAG: hypothetical protein P8Y45_22010 [Exilibacterium sp.]
MDNYEKLGYSLLSILAVIYFIAMFVGLIAAFPFCVNFCSWQGATTLHGRPHVRRSNAARDKKGRALRT